MDAVVFGTDCETKYRLIISRIEYRLARKYKESHEIGDKIAEHEKTCPKCSALANGTGLAGGLFKFAKLGAE